MLQLWPRHLKDVQRINEGRTDVVLTEPTSNDLVLEMSSRMIWDIPTSPSTIVISATTGPGVLLGSRGKIVIENNTFHTPGAAILLEGDARFWFEQAESARS